MPVSALGATRISCRGKSLHIVYAGVFALRATTKSGRVEAGCCAALMRRAAPWPETASRHVRRVASRLPSPPLAPVTNAASAAHEQPSLRSGCTKATGSACAPYGWCPAATRLIFRVARVAGDFVNREGGFCVSKPCQRPTGLSGGMPHGEGRRPSSLCGTTPRWTARSAGRQGFGCSWSREAQIYICQCMRNALMQAICRVLA